MRVLVIAPSVTVLIPLVLLGLRSVMGTEDLPRILALLGLPGTPLFYLLFPVLGIVLAVTVGTGHALDRWLLTVASLVWAGWLVIPPSVPPELRTVVLAPIVGVLMVLWNPRVSTWIRQIRAGEDAIVAGARADGRLP